MRTFISLAFVLALVCSALALQRRPGAVVASYSNDLRQHDVNAIAAVTGHGIGTANKEGVPGTPHSPGNAYKAYFGRPARMVGHQVVRRVYHVPLYYRAPMAPYYNYYY